MIEQVTYGPIDTWPGRLLDDDERTYTPFTAEWHKTERLLEREADMLDASTCVVRLALRSGDFYKDGSGITTRAPLPAHPGVIVVIDSTEHGVLTFSCDRYKRRGYSNEAASWQHNVRAIALGLEALRQAERYGIADRGQQYAGFAAIGSGVPLGKREPMTLDEAATVLAGAIKGTTAAAVLGQRTIAAACHRAAMRLLHPDHGGPDDEITRDKLARLHEAWSLVSDHHRLTA